MAFASFLLGVLGSGFYELEDMAPEDVCLLYETCKSQYLDDNSQNMDYQEFQDFVYNFCEQIAEDLFKF